LYFNNNYVIINLTLVYPLVNRNCQLLSIFHFLTVSFYFFVDKYPILSYICIVRRR